MDTYDHKRVHTDKDGHKEAENRSAIVESGRGVRRSRNHIPSRKAPGRPGADKPTNSSPCRVGKVRSTAFCSHDERNTSSTARCRRHCIRDHENKAGHSGDDSTEDARMDGFDGWCA